MTFSLRETPEQRLDLSPLVPHLLQGRAASDIAQIELQTTREKLTVGDAFHVRMGDPQHIVIEAAVDRLDMIGCAMASGEITVEGDAGVQAGRLMTGGRLSIKGRAGPWAASGMRGGMLEIIGGAGERLGGPLAGEMAGMRGGAVVVRGDVGERAGDRMRRGTIMIEGRAGPYAGSRMIAGTLIVRHESGPLPGYLMRRGTIIVGGCDELSPTFSDCGTHELVAMHLLATYVAMMSARGARLLRRPLQRFAGDMAVLGKGELFLPAS